MIRLRHIVVPAWLRVRGFNPGMRLIGAAVISVSHGVVHRTVSLDTHFSLVACNRDETMAWLAREICCTDQLILWRAQEMVSMCVEAARSAADPLIGAALLRALDRALSHDVVDAASLFGGDEAPSLDRVAQAHDLPVVAMDREALEQAHRIFCFGDIAAHLTPRVKALWRLWVMNQPDHAALNDLTDYWLDETNHGREIAA